MTPLPSHEGKKLRRKRVCECPICMNIQFAKITGEDMPDYMIIRCVWLKGKKYHCTCCKKEFGTTPCQQGEGSMTQEPKKLFVHNDDLTKGKTTIQRLFIEASPQEIIDVALATGEVVRVVKPTDEIIEKIFIKFFTQIQESDDEYGTDWQGYIDFKNEDTKNLFKDAIRHTLLYEQEWQVEGE